MRCNAPDVHNISLGQNTLLRWSVSQDDRITAKIIYQNYGMLVDEYFETSMPVCQHVKDVEAGLEGAETSQNP